jgi:queuine tRNA-ribosyltransferase
MTAPASTAPFDFRTDHHSGSARHGWFTTPHGIVETPAFMPVGTNATVRGLTMAEVEATGARIVLGNAYHLYLRPGDAMVRALGGLHAFSRWTGPMLTDSGGFQVYSLAKIREVNERGVRFKSPIDGAVHDYTPEKVMEIERNLGADIIMQLDELIESQSTPARSREAMDRSLRWLERCRIAFDTITHEGRAPLGTIDTPRGTPDLAPYHSDDERIAPPQALFPIVQGGLSPELRRASIAGILATGDWNGIAIGGLSVGESKPDMYATIEICDPALPRDRPRYLMGVGFPDDLVEGVRRGIDLFDCVVPTRMGRHGTAFTRDGSLQIKRSSHRLDRTPLVEDCTCPTCRHHDRAYLRHLFAAEEMLGLRLISLHNVHFLVTLMAEARSQLRAGTFASWSDDFLARYRAGEALKTKKS